MSSGLISSFSRYAQSFSSSFSIIIESDRQYSASISAVFLEIVHPSLSALSIIYLIVEAIVFIPHSHTIPFLEMQSISFLFLPVTDLFPFLTSNPVTFISSRVTSDMLFILFIRISRLSAVSSSAFKSFTMIAFHCASIGQISIISERALISIFLPLILVTSLFQFFPKCFLSIALEMFSTANISFPYI